LGLIWISCSSGIESLIPVGTNALPNGGMLISTVERKSNPESEGYA
jgi:hypothetical protein